MSLVPFTIRCTSEFNLFARFLAGEDIRPVLEQRADLGFNSQRIWCAYQIPLIGRLNPFEHPDYFDKWPELLELTASCGLYAEVTCFTGPYPFFPSQASMVAFWDGLVTALAPVSNLMDLEAVNEGDNGPNLGVPLNLLRQPGYTASHGSAVQDAPPMEPHWTVAGYRAPFSEWPRKVSHNAMEWADNWGIPVWTNEWPRTDNDAAVYHWFDAGASSALLCAGGCFHSPHGKDSTLFSGHELDCARAFIQGSDSVPLIYQTGAYSRLPLPYPPGINRIYRRTLGDGRFFDVAIRD